jgi:V/A-type H+-transporting ATPase subunit K
MVDGTTLAVIGAGIAVGASGIASAIGAGIVGSAGARSIADKPKNFSTSLLFQALPQTQGIYGFLIGILILLGTGVIGAAQEVTLGQGIGAIGAGLAVGLAAVSAIGQGKAAATAATTVGENKKAFGKSILFSVLPETQALYGFIIAILILIGLGLFGGSGTFITDAMGWGCLGAGLAVGLAGISGIGQGNVASAGISATVQDNKNFGKSILFSVLPETQALYGFIIAILLLIGFGVLGGGAAMATTPMGIIAIGAGVAVGLGAISAIGQGIVAAAGISSTARKPSVFGKSILFSVLPETQALYGFLIAILLLVGAGILGSVNIGLTTATGIVAFGASLAVGFAAVSAIGQGIAAASGVASTADHKSLFGKNILFSVLPETQALYGFLIAILLLVGSGLIGVMKTGLELGTGMVAVGAGLAVGLGAISAIGQGLVASRGINAVSVKKDLFGKSILFSVLPETQALYGFLIAILLLVGGGLVGAIKQGLGLGTGLVAIGAGLAVGLAAVSAIGQGMAASKGIDSVIRKKEIFGKSILFSVLPETQALYGFLIAILLLVGGGLISSGIVQISTSIGLIAIGAGLAVGLAAVSAIGQGTVAASSIDAVTEKTKMFGKSILFSVLPETQALYGFLIAILLLVGAGLVGTLTQGVTQSLGFIAVASALAVGLAATSAVGQGIAASSGVASTLRDGKLFGKNILFSVLPETQALYGFLIAILLLVGSGLIGTIKTGLGMGTGVVAIGIGLAVGIAAISAIGQGIAAAQGITAISVKKKLFGKSILFSVLPETQALYGFLIAILLLVGGGLIGAVKLGMEVPVGLVAVGAGLAVGISAISAIGQGLVAGAGIQSVTQKESNFGKSILFSVLPETQALYGFLVAILLLVGGGLLGVINANLTVPIGFVAVGAGLAVGIAGISAIGQGIAASSGSAAVTENGKLFGKSILFSVLPETQALYGTIIAILLLTGVGLLGTIKGGITSLQGWGGIAAGLCIGLAAISAIGQGTVAASSIAASLKNAK